MAWELVELNVGRLRAPLDDPLVADFVDNLERINGLGDASPGFVWRLQTEDGDATAVRAFDDETVIINLTVWASIEALADFVYRSGHVEFLRRKREWFEALGEAHLVMWWVPAGHRPAVAEAVERLEHLRAHGPSERGFTFRRPYPPPGGDERAETDERNVCPA
jgi:Domain of unknown function (DUF3291)